jgi:hypothetical protein
MYVCMFRVRVSMNYLDFDPSLSLHRRWHNALEGGERGSCPLLLGCGK